MRIPIHKTTSSSTEHDERAVPSRRARGERSRGRLTRRRFFFFTSPGHFSRAVGAFFGSLGCDFSSGVNAARAWGSRDLAGEPIPAARVRTLVSSLGTKHAGEVRGLRLREAAAGVFPPSLFLFPRAKRLFFPAAAAAAADLRALRAPSRRAPFASSFGRRLTRSFSTRAQMRGGGPAGGDRGARGDENNHEFHDGLHRSLRAELTS